MLVSSMYLIGSTLHYATQYIRLMHGHRKLRLAEDFEMFRLTPDFEKY